MANIARFESDNGIVYHFGKAGKTAFTMDFGSGMSVDIGTSQGFSQVGTSVSNQSVSGKSIAVNGAVYGDVPKKKKELRRAFAPFTSGKLIINDKYYIRVFVKNSPSFSIMKNNGRFSLLLYAPYPYFRSVKETVNKIGYVVPRFKFPVVYEQYNYYMFGEQSFEGFSIINNEGDVPAMYSATIVNRSGSTSLTISNITTGDYLKINRMFDPGDTIKIFRAENNALRVNLVYGSLETDILGDVTENSTLFTIPVGESVFSVRGSNEWEIMDSVIVFEETVVSVFED